MRKTLSQLRTDARRFADMSDDSGAINDATVNEYINQGWHELYDLIIDADDARIFALNATQLPYLGQHAFLLPAAFYRLISCDVYDGQSYVPATRADPSEYPELAAMTFYSGTRGQYFVRWNPNEGHQTLYVFPTPTSENLAITYFPRPKLLELDTDWLDNPASWLAFVAWAAAAKMVAQKERDNSTHLLELRRLGQRIEDSVNDLDMNSSAVVRDVPPRNSGGWSW